MSYLHADKTEALIAGFFVVQNEVGLGRHEEAYQRAYEIWAGEMRLPVRDKPPVKLLIRDHVAHTLYPDFTAWDAITIEIKALPRRLTSADELQLFDYLRARGDRLGLLVNMGLDRVHVERRIYDPPDTTISEDWTQWTGQIGEKDREIGMAIRRGLLDIFESHRTGYSLEVSEKLLLAAMAVQRFHVTSNPVAPATYQRRLVHESAVDCLVIENRFVITLTAQFESIEFARSLGLSHMKTLGVPWGIALNFGRTEFQVHALRQAIS